MQTNIDLDNYPKLKQILKPLIEDHLDNYREVLDWLFSDESIHLICKQVLISKATNVTEPDFDFDELQMGLYNQLMTNHTIIPDFVRFMDRYDILSLFWRNFCSETFLYKEQIISILEDE